LIELASTEPGGAEAAMERLLGEGFEAGLVRDAALAQNEAQAKALWGVREHQSAGQKPEGLVFKFDISVPLSQVATFLEKSTAAMEAYAPGCRVSAFGHMGDGNIHYDVIQPLGGDRAAFEALREGASRVVHDIVDGLDGSISAEHGLGSMKTQEAARYKDPAELAALRAIRLALDPKRIMNPRVLF
jgi:FAD/FMN-containing dehydrogenase